MIPQPVTPNSQNPQITLMLRSLFMHLRARTMATYPAWCCLLRGPESSCRHWGLLRFLYECLADVEYTVEDGSLGKYARCWSLLRLASLWTWSCRRGSSWSCGFYPFLRCVESRWDCRGVCLVMDDFFEGESITRGCGFMVEVGLMGARRLFWKVGYHLC
jgi:hypothetical protein